MTDKLMTKNDFKVIERKVQRGEWALSTVIMKKIEFTINTLLDALADEVKYCEDHDLEISEQSQKLLEHFRGK